MSDGLSAGGRPLRCDTLGGCEEELLWCCCSASSLPSSLCSSATAASSFPSRLPGSHVISLCSCACSRAMRFIADACRAMSASRGLMRLNTAATSLERGEDVERRAGSETTDEDEDEEDDAEEEVGERADSCGVEDDELAAVEK